MQTDNLALARLELAATGSTQILIELARSTAPEPSPASLGLAAAFRAGEVSQLSALAAATGTKKAPAYRVYPRLGVMLGTVDQSGLDHVVANAANLGAAALHAAPPLSLIKPSVVAAASAPTSRLTWGLRAMDVDVLWKQGLTGEGVRVAHLDTGVDGKHPALKGAVAAFVEFDMMGTQIKPSGQPWDSGEHGTHTAATVAGRPVKGRHLGVAPGAVLASALCIEGGQVLARVLGSLEWALDQNVKVLSMSLGFRGYTPYFLRIIQVLRANGILPVIASGNEGPGTSRSPGNYAESLSVGAIGENGRIADFSSSQHFSRAEDPLVPDVAGPGVGILSAKSRTKGYQSMDGTSMATPHIAGLAALLFQAKPEATVQEVEDAIRSAASPLAPLDRDRAVSGLPSAPRALETLLGSGSGSTAPLPARPVAASATAAQARRRGRRRKT